MNYFDYLKNKFPLYIISGTVVSLLAFAAISLNHYDRHLVNVLNDLQTVSLNTDKVNKQVNDIDSILDYIKTKYKIDINNINSNRQILLALDLLKSHMPEAKITATRFDNKMGLKQLPVEIVLNINSYNSLVNSVGYIESFRLPDYKIKRLLVSEIRPGEITLHMSGVLSMPGFVKDVINE